MTRWHPLEEADASIFTSAPIVFHYRVRYAASPARVWDSLASDASLADWGPGIKSVEWLSPRPFGVGTTRIVTLAGSLFRARERFIRWDEGRGYSFIVVEATLPILRQFAEDYVLEADGDGTLFSWRVAMVPKRAFALPLRLLRPITKGAFGRMAADGKRYFAHRA